jgi:hypothetical protein
LQIESNAYFPGVGAAAGEPPLFGVSHVQYSPPGEVTAMKVTNNILVLAVSAPSFPADKGSGMPRIVLIDLMRADEVMTVDIPRPAVDKQQQQQRQQRPDIKINALFPDPSGRHLLATLSTGETYYLSIAAVLSSSTSTTSASASAAAAAKPKLLRLRHAVTSVAYPPRISSSGITECLLGSPTGTISTLTLPPGQVQDDLLSTLTLKSVPGLGSKSTSGAGGEKVEKEHYALCTLPGPASPITGLAYGYLKSPSSAGSAGGKEAREKRGWIVATTPERKYEFLSAPLSGTGLAVGGKNGWGEEMCKRYFRDPSTIRTSFLLVSSLSPCNIPISPSRPIARGILRNRLTVLMTL